MNLPISYMKSAIVIFLISLSAMAAPVGEVESLTTVRNELANTLTRVENVIARMTAVQVKAGDNLQEAINRAQPGDVLMLESGATFRGNFKLPAKAGDRFVTITSTDAHLLPAGERVSPADAPLMARIESPNVLAAIATEAKAHHYRLVGLEIASAPNIHNQGLVQVSSGHETNDADLPRHIEVDRCYIHADPIFGGKRGIATNAHYWTVSNSYIAEFKSDAQDAQGIACWQCSNGRIVNNYIEGSGENVFFAEMSTVAGLRPNAIVLERNHLRKPLSWKTAMSPAGRKWVIKNSFEIKAGSNIRARGNVFENSWVSGQQGTLISFKAGADPRVHPSVTEDVLFEDNIVTGGLLGIQISGYELVNQSPLYQPGPGILRNVTIKNNVFMNLGGAPWGMVARAISMQQSPSAGITFENNTILGANVSFALLPDGKPSPGFVYRNNLSVHGTVGFKGPGVMAGNATLTQSFPGAVFESNVFIHPTSLAAQYPAGTRFVPSVAFDADGFTQAELPGIGADGAAVTAATAGVVQ